MHINPWGRLIKKSNNSERKNIYGRMKRKEHECKIKRQTLAGARTRVHTSKVAHKLHLDKAECFFHEIKSLRVTHGTCKRDTRHTRPKLGRRYTSTLTLHREGGVVVVSRGTPKRCILEVYTTYIQGSCPGRAWTSGAKTNWRRASNIWLQNLNRKRYLELYTHSSLKYNCAGSKYFILRISNF